MVSRCSGVASSSRRRRRDAKKSDDAEEDADDDVESCDVEDDECLLSEAGSDACDRDVLVEHRGWWDAGLARVSRCAARSGCERACWYGLLSPLVGFYCAGEFARRSGWLRGLVMTVVFAAAMTRFAPFGTARWGHCGFALASILAIARSFFQFGFGAQHCADGIAFVYALLVTGLVTSFALAAASDPGVVDLARADRLHARQRISIEQFLRLPVFGRAWVGPGVRLLLLLSRGGCTDMESRFDGEPAVDPVDENSVGTYRTTLPESDT